MVDEAAADANAPPVSAPAGQGQATRLPWLLLAAAGLASLLAALLLFGSG